MKLSIIIPTFNSANTLRRALDSIICQIFTDWEVLIMDGVSNDETLEIAKSYNDNRIRIFSEPDKGVYDAMNNGIDNSFGEWLYFLGSDDYLFSENVLIDIFKSNLESIDILYGNVYAPHLKNKNNGEWSIDNLSCNRCHQAIFYKKSIFKKTGKYDLKYPVLADHALNLQWFLRDDIKDLYINMCIAIYSPGGYSETKDDISFYNDFEKIILHYGKRKLPIDKKIDLIYYLLQRCKKNSFNKIKYYFWHRLLIIKRSIHGTKSKFSSSRI